MSEANKTLQFLAQERPSTVNSTLIFSPKKGEQVTLKRIWIANNDAAPQYYTLYFDNAGATYDETTMIAPRVRLNGGGAEYVDLEIPMRSSDGGFAVKSSKANAFNFTLIGLR